MIETFDPNTLTAQEMLDRAVVGIINQGGPGLTASGNCAYRTHGGKKCAIGWNIPDSLYTPVMELTSVDDFGLELGINFEPGHEFAHALQEAHDEPGHEFFYALLDTDDAARASSVFFAAFRDRLTVLCDRFNLSMPNVRWPDDEQVD